MKKLLLLLFAFAFALSANQIILAPSDVIGFYGDYSALFPASAILDNQTGVINEPSQDGSYWLNSDNGPADAYIVIDLGAAYNITFFDLFNTHNAQYLDRGTGKFSILASNTIAAGGAGATGSTLAGMIVTLVSGTLTAANGDPLVDQQFTSSDPGTYRYIMFAPESVATGTGFSCCGTNVYGLNELRVSVDSGSPEPAPLALVGGGFGLIALFRRRRGA